MSALACTVDRIEYRLALILPSSRTLWICSGRSGTACLPRVSIPTLTRVTPQIHQLLYTTWGIRGVVVDYLPLDAAHSPCAVIEVLSHDRPSALHSIETEEILEDELSKAERTFLLSVLCGRTTSPLSRLGWLYAATRWVEDTTGENIRSIQCISQLNAGGGFALLRFPMQSGQNYWLKATSSPNAHERSTTVLLSKLCPKHLPQIIGSKPEWNAWIMAEKHTISAELPTNSDRYLQALSDAVAAIADVQRNTIGHEADLFAAGAFDQRLDVLLRDSELLFEKIEEAMSFQTSTRVPRVEGAQLQKIREIFDSTCEYLRTLRIPNTVLHGDMNPGNVLWGEGGCQFIDWSEAYVGHPLVTLQHLLLLHRAENERLKAKWDRVLIGRYRAEISGSFASDAFDQALVCMPLIAAASALYGRGAWLRSPLADTLYRQARIRTLARHMHHASQDSALLNLIRSPRVSVPREPEVALCSQ